MDQRYLHGRHVELSYGGGILTWVVAVLSGIFVIGLAVVFSALFLVLLVAIGAVMAVRAWLRGRHRPSQPRVIDAEYTVIDERDPSSRRP